MIEQDNHPTMGQAISLGAGSFATLCFLALGGLALFGHSVEMDTKNNSKLAKKVIAVSEGRDGIWTNKEQRHFLSETDLDYVRLNPDQKLYLESTHSGVRVYRVPKSNKPSAKPHADEEVGFVSTELLSEYIRNHGEIK